MCICLLLPQHRILLAGICITLGLLFCVFDTECFCVIISPYLPVCSSFPPMASFRAHLFGCLPCVSVLFDLLGHSFLLSLSAPHHHPQPFNIPLSPSLSPSLLSISLSGLPAPSTPTIPLDPPYLLRPLLTTSPLTNSSASNYPCNTSKFSSAPHYPPQILTIPLSP